MDVYNSYLEYMMDKLSRDNLGDDLLKFSFIKFITNSFVQSPIRYSLDLINYIIRHKKKKHSIILHILAYSDIDYTELEIA